MIFESANEKTERITRKFWSKIRNSWHGYNACIYRIILKVLNFSIFQLCVLFFYAGQCSSLPANSKLADDSHYMLVSTRRSLTSSAKYANEVSSKAECPWTWHVDRDKTRYPRKIVYAICRNCKWNCVPVKYSILVLHKSNDARVWKFVNKRISVAFVHLPN